MAQKGLSLDDLSQTDAEQHPEIVRLNREIEHLKGYLGQQHESVIAESADNLNNEIVTFRNEVGQDGKPLRPHFDAVYNHMVHLSKVYREANPDAPNKQIMDAAYRDACRVHPQVSEMLVEERLKQKQSEHLKLESEKLKKARLAGSTLTGTPNGSSMVSSEPKSLRETLERNYDALSS